VILGTCVGLAWAAWRPIDVALAAKADWRAVAEEVSRRARPGDLVLTSNDWSYECLAYHLPRLGSAARLENAGESIDRAEAAVGSVGSAFFVAGGFHADMRIRGWMERAPVLFASHNEAIRVYYHPSLRAYLAERLPPGEQAVHARRLWDDLSGQVLVEGEPFLLEGWGDLERGADGQVFRWSSGPRSLIYVPVAGAGPSRLTINASPYGAVPDDQTITVSVDDRPFASVPLNERQQMYDVDLQGIEWTNGTHFVEFRYAATAVPAVVSPPSTDTRALAVVFRSVRFR
jgi:hypothetical protein